MRDASGGKTVTPQGTGVSKGLDGFRRPAPQSGRAPATIHPLISGHKYIVDASQY